MVWLKRGVMESTSHSSGTSLPGQRHNTTSSSSPNIIFIISAEPSGTDPVSSSLLTHLTGHHTDVDAVRVVPLTHWPTHNTQSAHQQEVEDQAVRLRPCTWQYGGRFKELVQVTRRVSNHVQQDGCEVWSKTEQVSRVKCRREKNNSTLKPDVHMVHTCQVVGLVCDAVTESSPEQVVF